ncbi:hypothetical protein L0337_16880 [candidate division KSB1 bacterium]|nr:hypothetical protein [candidate division KSB1 bacterium]
MKDAIAFCLALLVALCAALLSGCTDNPFFKDKVSGGTTAVRGSVQLADGQTPEGVFVWLDGFNNSARCDAAGRFLLNLPPQSASAGINGTFQLYFYVANYQLNSAQVVVRNGEFAYDQADINKNGELTKTLLLHKFLRIATRVEPSIIGPNFEGRLLMTVTLEAIGDTVTVKFPGLFTEFLAKAILKKVGSDEIMLLLLSNAFGAASSDLQIVGRIPYSRSIAFDISRGSILPGDYELIPYLLIKHETIPPKLIQGLGSNVEAFGKEYLKIPFRREGGNLKVLTD